jgi:hypothetical protein
LVPTAESKYPNKAQASRVKLQSFRFRVDPGTETDTGRKIARRLKKSRMTPAASPATDICGTPRDARSRCSLVTDSGITNSMKQKLKKDPVAATQNTDVTEEPPPGILKNASG